MRPNLRSFTASLCVGVSVAACAADSTGPGDGSRQAVSVSFSTAPGAAAALVSESGLSPSLSIGAADSGLVITKAQVLLARLELERVDAECTSDEIAGDDDDAKKDDERKCAELELAPTIVDLPVDGKVVTALNVTVPAGTYSEIEAKIRPVDTNNGRTGKGSAAFRAANPDWVGVSVRVEGTYKGKAFTYKGSPRVELEHEFEPPIAVTDKAANITVHVDVATWFKTSSGLVIDPALANAGGTWANVVAQNIRQSFRAFHDDDRDGDDDRGGRGRGKK